MYKVLHNHKVVAIYLNGYLVSLAVAKRYFVLFSFTARPILRAFSANLENATATSRSLLPMLSTSSAYAREA